jgi:hypothetical protein
MTCLFVPSSYGLSRNDAFRSLERRDSGIESSGIVALMQDSVVELDDAEVEAVIILGLAGGGRGVLNMCTRWMGASGLPSGLRYLSPAACVVAWFEADTVLDNGD